MIKTFEILIFLLQTLKSMRPMLKVLTVLTGPFLSIFFFNYFNIIKNVSEKQLSQLQTSTHPTHHKSNLNDVFYEIDLWKNKDECRQWAANNECEKNSNFMMKQCEKTCKILEKERLEYMKRCPMSSRSPPTLLPGDIENTFTHIMKNFSHLEPELISTDPHIILFNNFISEQEADKFIKYGKGRYQKSLGVGITENGKLGSVETAIRTSEHAWCMTAECLKDYDVMNVLTRISEVTQTPMSNSEYAQLVHYHSCSNENDSDCAFYKRHHDYIDGDDQKLQGPRIYTLFMYLNDVELGGGTRFTDLSQGHLTIEPKRGKALLWPSVLSSNPEIKDERTYHEALPVLKGEKYGANVWIHQYDFKMPYKKNCIM